MSEITKLYENAGVNQVCNTCELRGFKRLCPSKELCVRTNPPFTAEKQLEITKFLLKKAVYYDVKDDKYWFYYEECESAGYKPFDEAIAHFINKLWQDLTEEEKMSIKNILEI
jgi:hypothetical protein